MAGKNKKNKENAFDAAWKFFNTDEGGMGYVKGYDMQSVSVRKIEKGKLGDALPAVTDMDSLKQEIREAIENGMPVWGYFKKGQMWSCYIFEMTQVEKSSVEPQPQTNRDIMNIFRIKHMYIHPDVEQYADKMMSGIFSGIKGKAVPQIESSNKKSDSGDGFILNDRIYICKRTSNGLPIGLVFGLLMGVMYWQLMDNVGFGICMGLALSNCFGFSAGTIKAQEVRLLENNGEVM